MATCSSIPTFDQEYSLYRLCMTAQKSPNLPYGSPNGVFLEILTGRLTFDELTLHTTFFYGW
jgi:hypothetical protein